MYKKVIHFLTLFTIFFILIPKITFAFDEFIKYEKNPLQLNLEKKYSTIRQAHIYKAENFYEGVITIFDSTKNKFVLGTIYSLDGVNWNFKKEIFINDESQEFSNPRVFIDENNNRNLFFTKLENNNVFQIYYLRCDKDFNCDNPPKLIINPDHDENYGVFAPYVTKIENKFYIFYGSWGQQGFSIRIAHSSIDFKNWNKCSKKILSGNYDGPFILKKDNKIYLFYHTSNRQGIGYAETDLPLHCDSIFNNKKIILSPNQIYDQNHLIFPSLIEENNKLRLYYTAASNHWKWSLNFACNDDNYCKKIYHFYPIIIIPGFMGSWNGKAIIHNQEVSIFDWKIPSFVREYSGIINSLQNLGYKQNHEFFIFPYDWRKSLEQTSNDLNIFLQEKVWQKNPNYKINLVGYSLGGLVARIFAQKNKHKINQIISVGSPHQGLVQVYKPLEAGEIDRENTFLWLAQKIILVLNKSTIETDKETIRKKFPIALDLFPTFNFLKDKNNQLILVNNLSIKNTTLLNYNSNFYQIFDIFTAIYGEKDEKTPAGYIIESSDFLDELSGNYVDGKPIDIWYEKGDYTILSKSANQDSDSQMLTFDHGEIITKKESIKKIFDILNINYSDEKIIPGQKTEISPSLIFFIRSPAKMKINFGSATFEEEDGFIFIPNAQEGNYNLQVQGNGLGKYTVIIGQISHKNDLWEKIEGEIVKTPPESQIDNYSINFNPQKANSIFSTPTPTETNTFIYQLEKINTPSINLSPTLSINLSISITPNENKYHKTLTKNQTLESNLNKNNQYISSPPTPTSILLSSIKKQFPKEKILGKKVEKKGQNKEKDEIKNKLPLIEVIILIPIILISFTLLIIKSKFLKNHEI